jgi:hypothetical protein
MTKIRFTAPAPRADRIHGLTDMGRAAVAYFAARPGQVISRSTVELHLASLGFKRPASTIKVLSDLAHSGHLTPMPFGFYRFRAAA